MVTYAFEGNRHKTLTLTDTHAETNSNEKKTHMYTNRHSVNQSTIGVTHTDRPTLVPHAYASVPRASGCLIRE